MIAGDNPPEMPEVGFRAWIYEHGNEDPVENVSHVNFEWELTVEYDEGNYANFAEEEIRIPETGYIEIQGDTAWQVDFGDTLAGGDIEVTVTASLGPFADTAVRDGYAIKGENPGVEAITNHIEDESDDNLGNEIDRGLKAMVWQESANVGYVTATGASGNRPYQFAEFSGSDADFSDMPCFRYCETPDWWDETQPAFPLVAPRSGDHGWGLTQLTFFRFFESGNRMGLDRKSQRGNR